MPSVPSLFSPGLPPRLRLLRAGLTSLFILEGRGASTYSTHPASRLFRDSFLALKRQKPTNKAGSLVKVGLHEPLCWHSCLRRAFSEPELDRLPTLVHSTVCDMDRKTWSPSRARLATPSLEMGYEREGERERRREGEEGASRGKNWGPARQFTLGYRIKPVDCDQSKLTLQGRKGNSVARYEQVKNILVVTLSFP